MKLKQLRAAMLSACLLTAPAAMAVVTDEVEKGNIITDAQTLNEGDEMVVPQAVMEALNAGSIIAKDVDFFTFYGIAGDEVMITIENGLTGTDAVQTELALFQPASNGYFMEMSDRSINGAEPLIEGVDSGTGWTLKRTGIYTVGVVSYPRYFEGDGGGYSWPLGWGETPAPQAAGDYDLRVTFVNRVDPAPEEPAPEDPAPEEPAPTEAISVEISIKHGDSSKWASINPKSKGKLPVTIMSSPSMNAASEIDTASLRFGSTGYENSLHKCHKMDANGDGRLDLKCHFDNQAANFNYDDVVGILRGSLNDGTPINSKAPLKVAPHRYKDK